MTEDEEAERWLWPRYNSPGLLIGPVPHRRTATGGWVPDYNSPGVAERIMAEIDFIIDMEKRR